MVSGTLASRIGEAVKLLQPWFPAEKYGYADRIANGRFVVEGSAYEIVSDPFPADRPPPSFSCRESLILSGRELAKQGLKLEMASMHGIIDKTMVLDSVMPAASDHMVGVVREGEQCYFVGFTPLDQLFGIYPYRAESESGRFGELFRELEALGGVDFSDRTEYDPDNGRDIQDRLRGRLRDSKKASRGPKERFPLHARVFSDSSLAIISELIFQCNFDYFYLANLILMINLHTSRPRPELAITGVLGLEIMILPEDLEATIAEVGKVRDDFERAIEWLKRKEREVRLGVLRIEDSCPSFKELPYYSSAQDLLRQSWPTIAAFLSKLPADKIAQLY